jgi:glycosyltransferase involved in cell wall biosynthesis
VRRPAPGTLVDSLVAWCGDAGSLASRHSLGTFQGCHAYVRTDRYPARPLGGVTNVRITFVGPVPPIRSGVSQHGGRLTDALASDHDVTVLSWQHQYPKRFFPRAQLDQDARPHPTARFDLRWWDPVSWWRAGRSARQGDLVVLVWTTPFHVLTYRLIMALAGRARTVAIVHNALPHEPLPLQRPLTRWILSRCDSLVVHASTVAKELDELLGSRVETVMTLMPPLVDVEPQPLPELAGDGLRLLFFGFIRPYKGLDVALDALARLRQQGVRHRLTVAGEAWDPTEDWDEQVRRRGLSDQVELRLGYVADGQVSGLLAEHHAALLPYRSATQSGIAPIAFAAGRPVVATAVGGLTDVISDGGNGTLAAPGDATSLADAIQRCARDLPALAADALKMAPTWEDVAAAVVKAAGLDRSGPDGDRLTGADDVHSPGRSHLPGTMS